MIPLPWESPRRAWGLDEMIQYVCLFTTQMMEQFVQVINRLYMLQTKNIETLSDFEKQTLHNGVLKQAHGEANRLGMSDELKLKIHSLQFQMSPNNYVQTAVATREIELLHNDIILELSKKKFAYVPSPNDKYFEVDHLFGNDVAVKIPLAIFDIKDAGNSIAASLDTAAVFHLMRAAEHGLRALANKLRVSIRHKGQPCPLELGDWEQIITEIKNKIAATRQLPKGSKQRQVKLELYSDAADHCTFMKDIWRNNTAHTRKPYKQSEAIAILERVRDFMQFLGRIL